MFRAITGAILCVLTLTVTVACASHSALTAAPVAPTTSAEISTSPPVTSDNASALVPESAAAESRAAASSSSANAAAARAAAARAAAAKAAAAKAQAEKAAAAERAASQQAAADRAAAAQASAAQAAQGSAAPQAQASPPAAAACTPGYSPCIPPGPDVDCAGGSGNGPRYVQGPITVTGSDPYGLDSDHDGIGCEK